MLEDFIYQNKTKIYFGEKSLDYLKDELANYKDNILLVYGHESIKKIGLYDYLIKILNNSKKNVFELSDVRPNPSYEKVLEGIKLVKENNIDLILAVGGGSVIDCAKGISVGAYYDKGDVFKDLYLAKKSLDKNQKIVPVGSILTMVGTGSEMNGGSVITNYDLNIKEGRVFFGCEPRFSILNPKLTYTVSEYQMRSGIFDAFSHMMEQYFSGSDDNVSDDLLEALMKSLIKNSYLSYQNPKNYIARSNLMWIASMALNTILGVGKTQDWNVHNIEHQIGAYTDCAHGMGLAVISPNYYRYIYKDGLEKFKRFAINVFSVNPNGKSDDEVALKGIDCLEEFIKASKLATSLEELGVHDADLVKEIAYSVNLSPTSYKILNHDDVYNILMSCFKSNE